MEINKNQFSNQALFFISIVAILIYQFLWIFHGFDICDEGWYMTFYQQIFQYPEGESYNFFYWFTGIVGGLLLKANPLGGIIYIRIMGVVTVTLTYILTYNLLKKYFNPRFILIPLVLVVLSFGADPKMFFHNTFTSFLFILVASFLYYGLEKPNFIYISISGVILAFNYVTRLPNLIDFFVFSFLLILYSYINKERKILFCKKIIFFTTGNIFGCFLIYIIMVLLHHDDIFINSIRMLLSIAGSSEESHGLLNLCKTYIANYILVFKIGLLFFCILIFLNLVLILTQKNERFVKILVHFILIGITFIIFSRVFGSRIFLEYFISIGAILIYLIYCKNNNFPEKEINKIMMAAAALLMIILLPIGSDGGIGNMGHYSTWLAFPAACALIYELIANELDLKLRVNKFEINICITRKNMLSVLYILISAYAFASLKNSLNGYYFDKGSIVNKKSPIESKYANGIYTTHERAEIVNVLLRNLRQYAAPNDFLLCFDSMPMIHYLTETKPYIFSSWPGTNYSTELFEWQLKRAETEIPILPTIVIQKFWTIGNFDFEENYFLENKKRSVFNNPLTVSMVKDFISRYDYKIVWGNDYFDILQPKQR